MVDQLTRRRALKALGAAGVAGLAGCTSNGTGDGQTTQTTTSGDGNGDGDGGGGGGGSGTTTTSSSGTTVTDATQTTKSVSGTVKIGVLQPLSGSLKYYGQQSLWGFLSGLAHKAGTKPKTGVGTGTTTVSVGDVDYELVVRDTKFSADKAQTAATGLVTDEKVDLLFGATSSGSAGRVIKTVVKSAGVPFMVGPAASADITSSKETCDDLVFRASENTAMDARSGGRYVANQTEVSKVYLFGADYSFGKAVVNNYATVLKNQGVEIVGRKFVPRKHSEWKGLLQNAEDKGAEGIVGGFTVATLPKLLTAFLSGDYSYRVFGGLATQITNNALGQTLQKVLGKPLTTKKIQKEKLGPFTSRYHWNQYDNEINSSFVKKYTNAYGIVPDLFTSGTFTAASAIHQAVQESGSTNGGDIRKALTGMTVAETPKGQDGYTFQSYNNQARSAMTVAGLVPTSDKWADNWNAALMPSKPKATISGKKVTIPKDSSQMNCSG